MLPNYSFLRRLDMEPAADVLKQCTLFKDMTHKDIDKFLKVSRFSMLSKELSRMREEGDLFWRELNRPRSPFHINH